VSGCSGVPLGVTPPLLIRTNGDLSCSTEFKRTCEGRKALRVLPLVEAPHVGVDADCPDVWAVEGRKDVSIRFDS